MTSQVSRSIIVHISPCSIYKASTGIRIVQGDEVLPGVVVVDPQTKGSMITIIPATGDYGICSRREPTVWIVLCCLELEFSAISLCSIFRNGILHGSCWSSGRMWINKRKNEIVTCRSINKTWAIPNTKCNYKIKIKNLFSLPTNPPLCWFQLSAAKNVVELVAST